ncbi:MAG: DUF4136 domain-containing protein [Gammaproteobacteria bacterium]|nr:DUF4136 domain-containing protein [Gammaproteobacteria bacterium]MDH4253578.1 DUF4136 domain-containing protein [Gammaproteobacteria bacterium]MDH5310163.1 DUF4136 domain-containing protein [Gammaproteobacteria bacterium]
MQSERKFLVLLGLGMAMLFAACAARPTRVSTEVTVCCDAEFHLYETYSVGLTNVPGFLEAYLRGGLATVLSQKGLTETLDRPDLRVNMIFDQVFLTPDTEEKDYFGEGVDPGIATHFMAAVSVDVIDAATDEMVWSGRLSRIHHDPHGQPRGNDHKMQGIIDAFAELFADYPVRLTDTNDDL